MGRKVARQAAFALAFGLVIASMRCTVQLVNTQTTTVRSDTTGLMTKLDIVSLPTSDRPAATLRAYSTAHVRDTRHRTAWFRYRPAPVTWASTIGAFLAGCVAGWRLAESGRVVLGRDIAFVSAIPLIGVAWASSGTSSRRTTFVDTSRTTTPLPVIVTCGGTRVATLYPDNYGAALFDLKDHLGSLPAPTSDTALSVCVAGSGGPSRRFTLKAEVVQRVIEEQRAESLRAVEAESIEAERIAAEERARRIAEERRGTLMGMFPSAQCIPSVCQAARVVDEGVVGHAASVLANDMWGTFPELAARCNTELEKESFLITAEADSHRTLLHRKKSELTHGMLALQVDGARIFNYDVERGKFPVRLGEVTSMVGYGMQEAENEYGRGLAAHVVEGVWFDDLPLQAMTLLGTAVTQYLDVKVSSRARALDIERRRDSLQIWVAFRLTGNVRRLSRPTLPIFENEVRKFPEATDPVVMLVDVGKGDVVWSSR